VLRTGGAELESGDAEGVERGGEWGGVIPQLGGMGERRKLRPPAGSGA